MLKCTWLLWISSHCIFPKPNLECCQFLKVFCTIFMMQSTKEAQSKWCLHFYWTFHGDICCDCGKILMVHLLFSEGSPIKRHRAAQGYPSWWYNHWSVLREIQLRFWLIVGAYEKWQRWAQKCFFFFFRMNWQRAISCLIICFHLSSTKSYFRSRGKILRCKSMMILLFY